MSGRTESTAFVYGTKDRLSAMRAVAERVGGSSLLVRPLERTQLRTGELAWKARVTLPAGVSSVEFTEMVDVKLGKDKHPQGRFVQRTSKRYP